MRFSQLKRDSDELHALQQKVQDLESQLERSKRGGHTDAGGHAEERLLEHVSAPFRSNPRSLSESLRGAAVQCCAMRPRFRPPSFPPVVPPNFSQSSAFLAPPLPSQLCARWHALHALSSPAICDGAAICDSAAQMAGPSQIAEPSQTLHTEPMYSEVPNSFFYLAADRLAPSVSPRDIEKKNLPQRVRALAADADIFGCECVLAWHRSLCMIPALCYISHPPDFTVMGMSGWQHADTGVGETPRGRCSPTQCTLCTEKGTKWRFANRVAELLNGIRCLPRW